MSSLIPILILAGLLAVASAGAACVVLAALALNALRAKPGRGNRERITHSAVGALLHSPKPKPLHSEDALEQDSSSRSR